MTSPSPVGLRGELRAQLDGSLQRWDGATWQSYDVPAGQLSDPVGMDPDGNLTLATGLVVGAGVTAQALAAGLVTADSVLVGDALDVAGALSSGSVTTGTVAASGDVRAMGRSLPRGRLASAVSASTVATPASGAETVVLGTPGATPVPVEAGRCYRVTLSGVVVRSDAAGDVAVVRFRLGGSLAATEFWLFYVAFPGSFVGTQVHLARVFQGDTYTAKGTGTTRTRVAAGSHTFGATLQKNSGTANTATLKLDDAALEIEDIGVA